MAVSPTQINHVGVIMDGNRRWAKQHMLESVIKGHEKGVDKFMELCMWCQEARIPYLTVYAFSTENWKRSEEEVSGIMGLLEYYLKEALRDMEKNRVCSRFFGDYWKDCIRTCLWKCTFYNNFIPCCCQCWSIHKLDITICPTRMFISYCISPR